MFTLSSCNDIYESLLYCGGEVCAPLIPGAMLRGHLLLVGFCKANWSWARDQTKSDSDDPYEQENKEPVCFAQDRVTRAPWNQARGEGSKKECLVAGP